MDEPHGQRAQTRFGQFISDARIKLRSAFGAEPVEARHEAGSTEPALPTVLGDNRRDDLQPPYRQQDGARVSATRPADQLAEKAGELGQPPGLSLTTPDTRHTSEDHGYSFSEYFRTENGDEIRLSSYGTDDGYFFRVDSATSVTLSAGGPYPTRDVAADIGSRQLIELLNQRDGMVPPLDELNRDPPGPRGRALTNQNGRSGDVPNALAGLQDHEDTLELDIDAEAEMGR